MTLYFLLKYLHVLGAIVLMLVALLTLDNR
ncbi:hypothetical protein SAMN05444171_3606 [Bradyrhizobium lablabi]|jgi:hypothetical protein|uniref:DUF2269 domain-containing protein n=2 Tax=Bradyrhizobium TaxID=374 RepID=A0ABY0PPE0_9BRAD|nr:hypothetical protein SAMN05444163_3558 [Bradyrhizobium ottawaense]SED25829.1 hypothetical protein SAMN05444171_3606 [Bradyrhizobium lablabi]SHL29522.1 hypothetical protein SAMN05444321_2448 [Bradyrhizobium lablabi]